MTLIWKAFVLLNERERRQALLLIPLVIGMAMVEVMSVASIAPFLSLMADPEAARTNPPLAWAYGAFGEARESFVVVEFPPFRDDPDG